MRVNSSPIKVFQCTTIINLGIIFYTAILFLGLHAFSDVPIFNLGNIFGARKEDRVLSSYK